MRRSYNILSRPTDRSSIYGEDDEKKSRSLVHVVYRTIVKSRFENQYESDAVAIAKSSLPQTRIFPIVLYVLYCIIRYNNNNTNRGTDGEKRRRATAFNFTVRLANSMPHYCARIIRASVRAPARSSLFSSQNKQHIIIAPHEDEPRYV